MVVVEHAVERLHPLGVDVSVEDDPVVARVLHHFPRGNSQHSLVELAGVVVHLAQQLLPRHRFRVHQIRPQRNAHLLEATLQHLPDRGLAAPRRTDQHNSHSLLRRLVKLQDLGHLSLVIAQLHLLDHHLDGLLDLLVDDVLGFYAWEDVLQQKLELSHIGEGQL